MMSLHSLAPGNAVRLSYGWPTFLKASPNQDEAWLAAKRCCKL